MDTLVSEAVKRSPLEFVEILHREAATAGKLEPLLHEAGCVIANLLLTDEEWHLNLEGNDASTKEGICGPSTHETNHDRLVSQKGTT